MPHRTTTADPLHKLRNAMAGPAKTPQKTDKTPDARRPLGVTLVIAAVTTAAVAGCIGEIGQDDGKIGGGPQDTPAIGVDGLRDPGSKTIHRLNRVEYDNTVRDLLGTTTKPSVDFPADDHGYGFDNIADVLSLPPLQLELYERAAERLIDEAFAKPEMVSKLVPCSLATDERGCATKAIGAFATKAFRRPVGDAEVTRLLGLFDVAKGEGGTAQDGVKLAMRAALVSPHFIFRIELDPDLTAKAARPLNDYELASRLSYFLWSSMPDDTLFDLARDGKLEDPGVLRTQAMRMLEDPRSNALVSNFAGQWLSTRELDEVNIEKTAFPSFDDTLRTSMKKETELFFKAFLENDLDMKQFLTADFTFIDARLATHYGMEAPTTPWAKVTRDPTRRGLLGLAGLLTTTSYPNRTSPVKRGAWVLHQLLCTPPPPPPPGVEGLKPEATPTGTIRDRMEAHRTQPVCRSCHEMMDPIGFALENFDGIGKWRTEEAGFKIDASGKLPGSGATFTGGAGMSAALAEDSRVGRCITEHLYTYALGRGPAAHDHVYLDDIADKTRSSGNRMKELIVQIVISEPFRMRRVNVGGGS